MNCHVNKMSISNVFLINTFEETEPNALELENLFKKFDINVYGIMKKKDATSDNLMNSVEEFRKIIQNKEPTLLLYFGWQGHTNFTGYGYLVTSDDDDDDDDGKDDSTLLNLCLKTIHKEKVRSPYVKINYPHF